MRLVARCLGTAFVRLTAGLSGLAPSPGAACGIATSALRHGGGSGERANANASPPRVEGGGAPPEKTGKKVLVLGGSGFVGRALCDELLADGYSVIAVSRRGRPSTGAASPPSSGSDPARPRVTGHTADVTTEGAVAEVLAKVGFSAFCVHALLWGLRVL